VVASAPESAAAVALTEVARRVAGQVSLKAREGGYAMELPVI
jgi:hypothetical protein